MLRRLALPGPLTGLSLLLVSCGGDFFSRINEPLAGGGNALDPPGYQGNLAPVVQDTGPAYQSGDWVETSVPQAALYGRKPKTGDQPAKTLPLGTDLKVVSTSGTYVRVELESGEVGYVPAIMLMKRSSATEVPLVPSVPDNVLPVPPSPFDVAPEPEIPPISVEDAQGVPSFIDPEANLE